MYSTVVLSSLAALAVAAPYGIGSGSGATGGFGGRPGNNGNNNGQAYLATFEDLDASALPLDNGSVGDADIGPYDGLDYQGMALASPRTGTGAITDLVFNGVQPRSGNNVAAYGGIVNTVTGVVGGVEDTPLITTQYPGSVNNVFDFKSFYFGCNLADADTLSLGAATCTITVTGYRNTQQTGRQTIDFVAGSGISQNQMKMVNLGSGFNGIDTVIFDTMGTGADITAADALVATLLDDLSYNVYPASNGNNNGGQPPRGGNYGQNNWGSHVSQPGYGPKNTTAPAQQPSYGNGNAHGW